MKTTTAQSVKAHIDDLKAANPEYFKEEIEAGEALIEAFEAVADVVANPTEYDNVSQEQIRLEWMTTFHKWKQVHKPAPLAADVQDASQGAYDLGMAAETEDKTAPNF